MEIRKCVVCGRLLKKQDDGESCKKCSVQSKNTLIEVPAPVGNGVLGTVEVAETSGEVNDKEPEIIVENSDVLPEPIVELITNDDPQPQKNTQPTKIEEIIKPGNVIRARLQQLINEGKINNDALKILISAELTKANLGIRYAFLLEYDETKSTKEQGAINGHVRYSSKKLMLVVNSI